eukprot:gene9381-11044_t
MYTTQQLLYSNAPSWLEFYEDFSSDVPDFRREIVGPVSLAGEEAAFAYFSRCAGNQKAKKNSNEKSTPSCADMLVRLPNVILENVAVDVYDFSLLDEKVGGKGFAVDNATKSLTCVDVDTQSMFSGILGRLPAENDFPECGVRLPGSEVIYFHNEELRTFQAENDDTGEEGGILKYDHLPVFPTSSTQPLPLLANSLPKDRNSPFRVAFIISLLKRNQKLGHPRVPTAPALQLVQECADHLQGFLENTPGRSVAFGAVTNLQECFFVAVRVFEGSVNHNRSYWPYNSSLIIGKEKVARELARFCATDPLALGVNADRFRWPHLTMQGCWHGDRIALKVSMNKNVLELERIMLGYLETKGVEHVPRIHRAAQEDLYKRYNESCTAYSTVLIRIPEHTLKEEQILQVWGILRCVHAVGIVHRDVHSVHMMCDKTGIMYLKGFAAAQFYNPSLAGEDLGRPLIEVVALYNPRNTNTASAAVLRDNLPTLPADDACAIIYATIQVNFPKSSFIHFPLYAEDNAFRAKKRDKWPDQWREELTPAMSHEVSIIQASLAELEKHRADLAYTVEEMDIAVQEAVKAVYRFKAAHQALKLPHSMWGDDDSNDEDGPQVPRRVWAPRRSPDRGTEPIPLVTESYYYDERLFGGLKKQRTTSR